MEQRFFKDENNGCIAGVCAGLSDYFGGDVTMWRVCTVFLAVCTPFPIVLLYIIIGLVAPDRNDI